MLLLLFCRQLCVFGLELSFWVQFAAFVLFFSFYHAATLLQLQIIIAIPFIFSVCLCRLLVNARRISLFFFAIFVSPAQLLAMNYSATFHLFAKKENRCQDTSKHLSRQPNSFYSIQCWIVWFCSLFTFMLNYFNGCHDFQHKETNKKKPYFFRFCLQRFLITPIPIEFIGNGSS